MNRDKNGRFIKGHIPFNKGTKGIMKPNSGSFKKGHKLGLRFGAGQKGHNEPHSEETKTSLSKNHIGILAGDKHPGWKGGISRGYKTGYHSREYKLWRKAVFERDNYTCRDCGIKSGNGETVYLEPHHIKSFTFYPELRFTTDNGMTLCKECHNLTKTGGGRPV